MAATDLPGTRRSTSMTPWWCCFASGTLAGPSLQAMRPGAIVGTTPAPAAVHASQFPGSIPKWLVRLDAYERARDRYLAGLIAETSGNTGRRGVGLPSKASGLQPRLHCGLLPTPSRASLHSRSDPRRPPPA